MTADAADRRPLGERARTLVAVDGPPIAGLVLLTAVFYWPILTGQAFLWGDFAERVFPFRQYAAVELGAGRLPLWMPYLFGGIPFLPMIDNGVLYPLNWLLVPLVRDGALSFYVLELYTLAHVFLLGLGTYCFCRAVGVSRAGAFLAAVCWMFSGPIVHHVFHPAILQTLTWLPLVLLLLMRALDASSLRLSVAAGAAWGMAVLAGHPQAFLYMAYAMGLYYVVCVVERMRATGGPRAAMRLTGLFFAVVAMGLAIGAVAFLPAYELAGLSERGATTAESLAWNVRDFRHLVNFVTPEFFGQMGPATWDYWGPGTEHYGYYWETHVYLGVLPILLAGAALIGARQRLTRFLGLLTAFCLLGILGETTPFPRLLHDFAPGFGMFRAHARLGLVMGFAVAVLAGLGLDALRKSWSDEGLRACLRRYLALTGGLAVALGLAALLAGGPLARWLGGDEATSVLARASLVTEGGRAALVVGLCFALLWAWQRLPAHGGLLIVATLALTVGDLFSAGAAFNASPLGPDDYFTETPLVHDLQALRLRDGGRVHLEEVFPLILRRNAGVVFGLETALAGFSSPLRLAQTTPPTTRDRVLDLMNVTHEVRTLAGERSVTVVERPEALARAWVVRSFVVAPDMEAVAVAMADSAFDYRTMVTLDRAPTQPISPGRDSASERPTVTHQGPNRIVVEVDMEAPGVLVLSEVFYPAWRAYSDGQERPILRADGTLRAVELGQGSHVVEFSYRSTQLTLGALISLIALIIAGGTGVSWWRSRRQYA